MKTDWLEIVFYRQLHSKNEKNACCFLHSHGALMPKRTVWFFAEVPISPFFQKQSKKPSLLRKNIYWFVSFYVPLTFLSCSLLFPRNSIVLHVLLISVSFHVHSSCSSMFFWVLLFFKKQWKQWFKNRNQRKLCFKSQRVMSLNFHWFPTMLSSFGFRVPFSLPFKHPQKPKEMKGTSSKHHCFTRFASTDSSQSVFIPK